MPSIERDVSAEHSHAGSVSDSGRLSVPMWDSSDPERAPPPLPLNPGSPSLTTRPNTSVNIQAAAKALSDRARESLPASSYVTNSMSTSPEKSLIKGAQHRRMQSMQTGGVRDLRSFLDGMRSGSPERPNSRSGAADDYFTSPDRTPSTPTPAPASKDPLKDTPSLKPTARPPPRPILGENTPPSSTMRALQTLAGRDPDTPLNDVTNNSPGRHSHAMDDLSSQLLNLTTIATNLQKEMAQLSRRSKDNATDLISLKEATKTRDEDIRKNLRDVVSAVSVPSPSLRGTSPNLNRSGNHFGLGLLDSKAYNSPPHIPRAASHSNFLEPERIERMGSPSLYPVETTASIAMLEKIIREMTTKDGQEHAHAMLSDLINKSGKENVEMSKKLSELAQTMKERSESQALVRSSDNEAKSDVNPEVQKILARIKDSVTSTGGLTAEVKALLRELRGEILGMGRELSRRLDQVGENSSNDRAVEDPASSRAEVERIIKQGMEELREHLETLIQENNRQSMAVVQSREANDGQEMYSVVKHALAEHGSALTQTTQATGLDRDDILTAVKEACEDFKPEIELQQFGLERDEILQVLREGFESHQASNDATQGVSRDEVMDAMHEAVQGLTLPQPAIDMEALRGELVNSVRECLEDFQPRQSAALDHDTTRELIHDSVKSGLAEHGDMTSRVMEISRDDLFDAVKAGLDGSSIPFGGFGEQVLQQLQELVDGMRAEFKQYSAANGRDTEQVLDAVKDGLETLRTQIENYVDRAQDVTGKDEIVDVVRGGLEQLRSDVQGYCAEGSTGGRNDMLDYIKAEFEHLHETIGSNGLASSADKSRGFGDDSNEDIMEAMKEEFERLKHAIIAGSADNKSEILEALQDSLGSLHNGVAIGGGASEDNAEDLGGVREELEHLRETIAATLIKSGAATDKDEILDAVREAVTGTPFHSGSGVSTELLEAIRGEFENLRNSVSQTMVGGASRADHEEVLDTVRLGLDDLRSHVDKKLDNPEHQMSLNSELLDSLHEGLDGLRTDITKTLERPVDMTVNYEILDTLKEGLAALRADMDKLINGSRPSSSPKSGEIVLADADLSRELPVDATAPVSDSVKRNDIERMEVILAQLQIKVEAMSANIQDMPAAHPTSKAAEGFIATEELASMEAVLKEVQSAVLDLAAREKAEVENAVTKDDTDAIETLLRNTKSHLEEVLPTAENVVTREHIDAVEAVVRVTNEAVEGLAIKIEESGATKADVAVVEVLAHDLKTAVDEIKESMPKAMDEDNDTKLTKTDLDVLGVICTEIKTKINDMVLPDVETLPTKSDIEQLTGLMNDFRDGHDKFRDSYEKDIAVTAQAFDDRKQDTEQLVTQIAEVRTFLEEVKDELLTKVSDGESGETIYESLKGLEEKLDEQSPIATDLKELMETVKMEFERAHGSLEGMKVDHEERSATMLEAHDGAKDAIISGVTEKIDSCFDGLMSKYDDAQHAAEEKAKVMEEKAMEQESLLSSTKEMADDLRISIDTLGTALTASTATFTDATEKIGEDSKTVFNRVDDTYNKLDETQEGLKAEHQLTRGEVAKTLDGISGLQGDFTEYHPRFMMSLKELHALVSQHYEHSQKLAESSQEHAATLRAMADGQSEKHEELKSNLASGLSSLPALLPAPTLQSEPVATRDDPSVHEKLDKLLDHSTISPDSAIHEKLEQLMEKQTGSGDASAQLERLDQIHQQVMATAAEVTAFVAVQSKQITNEHESKEKEAEEVSLVLERRLAQKDQIESDITGLNGEKESLQAAVEAMRAEKEALAAQKSRLNADVSALHTALEIRREELRSMDHKADALERRILEGLMNQSRSLLLAKAAKPVSPKKPKGRDLRIPSTASTNTVASAVPSLQQTHALVLKSSRPQIRRNAPNNAERRIMSLSQISRNVPSGGQAYITAPALVTTTGPGALKRSHTVKNPASILRKSSWQGSTLTPMEGDKENEENDSFSEESETETDSRPAYTRTNTGRTGMTGVTNASLSYTGLEGITPSTEGGRSSYGTSEWTYGTGSYMTGSEIDRRTSLGSTIAGTVGGQIDEEDEEEEDTEDVRSQTGSAIVRRDMYPYSKPEAEIETASEEKEAQAEEQEGEGDDQSLLTADTASEMVTRSEVDAVIQEVRAEEIHAAMMQKDKYEDRVPYAPPSDSGLGTDLPTAALSGSESGYFGMGR